MLESPAATVGFWRRAIAFVIDCATVALVLQVLAMGLYGTTGGRVQSEGIFRVTECHWPPKEGDVTFPYGELTAPDHITSLSQKVCRASLFGIDQAHYLVASAQENYGGLTVTTTATILLDDAGRAVRVLWLDAFFLPLLLLLRVPGERRTGQSPGKRVMGIRVKGAAGPPTAGESLKRNLLLLAPLMSSFVPLDLVTLASPNLIMLSSAVPVIAGVLALVGLAWTILLIFQTASRRTAIHDSFAGTAVVRANDGPGSVEMS